MKRLFDWIRNKWQHIAWRSVGAAVSSVLTMLAVAPYTLGDASDVIPPKWKPVIFKVCLASGLLLRLWNSRKQPTQPVNPPAPPQALSK